MYSGGLTAAGLLVLVSAVEVEPGGCICNEGINGAGDLDASVFAAGFKGSVAGVVVGGRLIGVSGMTGGGMMFSFWEIRTLVA